LLLIAIAISWWVRNSKYGLGLLAIRDDEDRALGLGVKAGPFKLIAFVISAFIVGMVGALWAYYIFAIYPASAFDATFDVAFALMAFLGGLGTISGPILGALLLESTQQYFTIQFGVQGYYLVIYGALFLVVILLLPRGIIPTLREYWAKYEVLRTRRGRSIETRSASEASAPPASVKRSGAENQRNAVERITMNPSTPVSTALPTGQAESAESSAPSHPANDAAASTASRSGSLQGEEDINL
jgi:branched-chain amino acid transport system permease protein